jgi:hypothetical protein
LGDSLERQGRLEEAIEAYHESIRIVREEEAIPYRRRDCWMRVISERVQTLQRLADSGNIPEEAVHRTVNVPGEPERSPVDCTVFAPDRVEPKQTGLLQAFLHAPEARRQTEAAAKQFDPKATERGHRSLVLDAPIGTTFAFVVEIEGFVLPERTDTLLWTGQPHVATFRFDVRQAVTGTTVGTVLISQDGNRSAGSLSDWWFEARGQPTACGKRARYRTLLLFLLIADQRKCSSAPKA